MYYDKDGVPITMLSWAILMETDSYRVLKQDTALNGSWVSTVWLGIDHNIGGRKLHIFETMVFAKNDRDDVVTSRRYATQQEALLGHAEVLQFQNEAPRYHLRKLEP